MRLIMTGCVGFVIATTAGAFGVPSGPLPGAAGSVRVVGPELNGMLVTVYGKVTTRASNYCVLASGGVSTWVSTAGLASGNTITLPSVGSRARITGLIGRATISSIQRRVIRPRSQADVVMNPPTVDYTLALPAGISQFSLPFEPIEPNLPQLLPVGSGRGQLSRWDMNAGSWAVVGSLPSRGIGGLHAMTSYKWQHSQPVRIILRCYVDANDRWMPVPTAGSHLVAASTSDVPWNSCRVTNGSRVLSVAEAAAEGWLQSYALYWDTLTNTYKTLAASGGDDTMLRVGRAYWVTVSRDDLAFIIPTPVQ